MPKGSRRTVLLGQLSKGRVFWVDEQKYKVITNLAPACVSVRNLAERDVTIDGRTFTARSGTNELWSASTEVEIEVRKP